MALTCPHVIWRITPFNTLNHCFSESFEFFNCVWRWEYSVQSKDDNEGTDEIVSIHLRRLTNSPTCSLTKFSTIAALRNSDGEQHAIRFLNHKILHLVSWCVWRKSKSYIFYHKVVENNGCSFSLTFEPLDYLEHINCHMKGENYNSSSLQELSRNFDQFLTHSKHTDVILKCGNTEIKAHKDVLCFRSKKFLDVLDEEDNLEKTSMENLSRLVLPSMDPVVFIILLRYIYAATLPDLTTELARKIYKVANEYSIDSLKKRCAQFIIDNLNSFNAIDFLQFANEHDDDDLKWSVSSYIAFDINILNSDEWKKFSRNKQGLAIDVFKIFAERINNIASSEISEI